VTRAFFIGEQHRIGFPIIDKHVDREPMSPKLVEAINAELKAANLAMQVSYCACCDTIAEYFPNVSWA
jgi:hypothetical protein